MTSQQPIVWRIAATVLWIVSVACLFKAVTSAAAAEQSLNNPNLTAANRLSIQQAAGVADDFAVAGWALQFVTAAVLSFGIKSPRVVRRTFVSLGILIAVDGIALLLTAVIVR